VITVPGTISITPLTLTINSPSPSKGYDATNAIVARTLAASNAVGGDQLIIRGSGTYASANAGTGLSYTINSIAISGVDAANYAFTGNVTGSNGEITRAVLTISGATVANKAYDGTNAATFSSGTLNGLISTDSANLILTQSGTFSQINVGDNLVVTATNTLSGSAADNYSLTQPTGLTANITPKALTVTGTTVANKTYNGNDLATVSNGTLVGVVGSDNVSLVQAGNFSTANVGTGLTVTITDSLSNNAAGNYTLIQPTGFTANITAKALTVTGTSVANKIYDGNNIATISGGSLVGVVGSDNVTLTETASFGQSDVGNGLAVTISNVLGGTSAGNYTLTQPSGLTANITPKALTVIGTTVANKIYDRTNVATVSGGTLVGVVAGEIIGLVQAGTFGQINVGSGLAVTIADTLTNNASGNYSLVQPTGLTADITPKALSVTGTTVSNKIYNGNNVANIADGTLVGVVSGDNVSLNQVATFSQADVGTALVVTAANTLSNNAAGNYTLVQPTGLTADITPKAITIDGAAVANKVYDGTNVANFTAGTLSGVVGSDDVVLTRLGTFSQSTIGTGLTVTSTSVLSGAAANNYELTQPTGLSANISAKTLTVTGAVIANKVYDGNDLATFSAGTLTGVVSSDTASLVVTQGASFSQANVGNNLTVTAAYAISGSAAGNYTLTQPSELTANITPAPLGIAVAATYSGSTTITPTSYTVTGLVNGETITGISSATVSNANIAANGSNYVTAISTSGGTASISNYAVASGYSATAGSTQNTATIAAKALTITADDVTAPVYGTAYSLGTTQFTASGLVGNDAVNTTTLSYGSGTSIAATTNAGTYSASIIPSAAVGTGLANYTISYVAGNLTVGKATLNITPIAVDTVFNASILDNAAYSQNITSYTVSGYKNSDSVVNVPITLSGSMSFAGATNTAVQDAASYSLMAGTLAGSTSNNNYVIAFANNANNEYKINPATLSISATKIYDGNATFAANAVSAVTTVGNQAVTLTGSGTANSADVLGVSSLSTTGLSVANSAFANNYILPATSSNVSITPASITVSIASQSKVYDATNTASLSSASYQISGFISGQGASINQANAIYNSADVASATTVSTTLSNANFVVSGSTNLSNYSLPLSVSGSGTITRATLTMTADSAAKFVGQADPVLTYTLTGLKGTDTSSVLINPTISRQAGNVATSDPSNNGVPYTITPSASAANYTVVPVTAGFTVVAQGQLLIGVGNTSATYGTLTANNLGTAAAVSASYCTIGTDCSAPHIINLAITAGSSANTWIATDSEVNQGKYTLTVNLPSLTNSNSSTGGYLNVGTYRLTPSSTVSTVAGYATNYVTSYPVLTVAGTTSITPLLLNINTPSPSKAYDANNVIIGRTLTASNSVLGDQLLMTGSGTYASINAGTGLSYAINSVAISGADAGNYAFSGTVTGTNGVITPAALTVSGISANNKVYDATNAVTFSGTPTLIGVVQGDTVTVTGTPSASFPQSDVGNNLSVIFGSDSLAISNGNYYISGLSLSQTANITPAPITVTAAKLYDGSVSLSGSDLTITGVAGQTLGVSSGGAVLTNANVGSAALQSLNNLQLSNGTGVTSNYTLSNPIFGAVNITPAPLAVTATAGSMVYGSAVPTLEYTYTGLVGNDGAASFSGSQASNASNTSNIGSGYQISQGTLMAGGNYTIASYLPANLTVTPAPLVVTAVAKTMVYGATVPALSYTYSGLVNNDSEASFSGNVTTTATSISNVGSYGISQANLAATGNYTIASYVSANVAITPAPLTITAAADSKVYGSTTTASGVTYSSNGVAVGSMGYTVSGLVSGLTDSVTGATITSTGGVATASVNGGMTYAIIPSAVTGSGLDNYSIAYVNGALTVTPATLTVAATGSNKVYDGNTVATVALSGNSIGSDVITIANTSATFANKNVGTAKSIAVAGLSLSGADAGNYVLASNSVTTAANITPKTISANFSIADKVYDATTAATFTASNASGIVQGDAVSFSAGSAAFATPNVGSNKPVTVSAIGLIGADAGNYVLNNTQANFTANITPAPLTITALAKSIVYGDRVLPTLTYTQSGLLGSDVITGSLAAPTNLNLFNGNDGSASPVSSIGVTYPIGRGTVDAGNNYSITYVPANVSITPKSLLISTAPIASITYGTALNLNSVAAVATGLINGDYITAVSAEFVNNGSNVTTVGSATSAGSYAGSIQVLPGTATGRGLSNYNPSYVAGDLTIGKANLTVTAVNDAKLVTTADATGYLGVMASGFKNGQTLADLTGTLAITRSNSTINGAGTYRGVLNAAGLGSSNYVINYVAGDYTILPANTLLVKLGNVHTAYGSATSYSPVASYVTANNTVISSSNAGSGLTASASGNQITVIDNAGGQYSFTASPTGGQLSTSGNLRAGSYLLTPSAQATVGANFGTPFVTGALSVQPRSLVVGQDFTLSTISKVYDGNISINAIGSAVNVAVNSRIMTNDVVQISATGSYASKNVGNAIAYTVDVNLGGADSTNYYISGGSSVTANNGVITQLTTPVSWVGPTAGGYWSNPNSWAGGAIPDFANVQNTIIPVGVSVVYDAGLTSPVQTIVSNSGNIIFASLPAGAQSIVMNINGSGTVTISDGASIRLAGASSSYSGNTILESGSRVIAATNNAIGAGNIQSNGGEFGVASSVVLPRILATGSMTLISSIDTVGTQSYGNLTLASTANGLNTSGSGPQTIALTSSNADITINGTIDGIQSKTQSSIINAGSGVVTLGDSIGSIARLNDFTVTGSRINILADILTGMTQTYNGSTYIGNASYIGRPATVGFLYQRSYIRYFDNDADTTILGSSIAKLNDNPMYVRTLISVDPSITFNGTVNDTVTNTHTLLLAAISDQSVPASAGVSAINNAASINFNGAVGGIAPLYSLNAQVSVNQIQPDSASSFIGQINVKDGVTTYSDQIYRANSMTAQASSRGGEVAFSVWDPKASITFNLPRQTLENSNCIGAACGQLNLQNPGSLDLLRFNGDSNYLGNQNIIGVGRWAATALTNEALGYIPPPVMEPLRLNQETGATLKQALQLMLASNETLVNTGGRSRVDVSMTSDAASASSNRDRIGSSEFRMMAGNQATPAPEKGFVNIIFKLLINGMSIQSVSTSPQKGFELKLPPMALPKLEVLLQQQSQDGDVKPVTLVATMANGMPLPSWLKFNPETQTFSASSIPEGTPDIQVKLQAMQGGTEVDQVVFTIDTP
jgi:hypothetical protein